MIKFLFKGLLRDQHRSLFPLITVSIGVFIVTLLYCYLQGFSSDIIRINAVFDTGHLKIVTKGYAEIPDQCPNDLCLINISSLLSDLNEEYPQIIWQPRIKFGGLLDFPDDEGNTRAQGPVIGIAADLLNPQSGEIERFNLQNALVKGNLPASPRDILISREYANTLGVDIGDIATLISATANGAMAVHNFKISGFIVFGVAPLDHNAILADIAEIQYALDMENASGEIIGFFQNDIYKEDKAKAVADDFNRKYSLSHDEFTPVMMTLSEQNNLAEMLNYMEKEQLIFIVVFVFIMSIVLWNAGLISGIRRYGEFGLRLAVGESKNHVYKTLIAESILIGIIGSVMGAIVALAISYYLQEVGYDMTKFLKGSSMMMSNVIRAQIDGVSYIIGFFPGLLATLLGSMISGIGIFKRQTSQLFKELET